MRPTPEVVTAYSMIGATSVLSIPIIRRLAGSQSRFIRDLGFVGEPQPTRLAWLLSLGVAAGYIAFTALNVPPVRHHWLDFTALKLLSVALATTAGLVEEAFFRRWLMDSLARRGWSTALQVMASAVIFGVAHGTWGLFSGSAAIAAGATLSTTVLGCALAIVYCVGGRRLAPCIVAHALIDAVVEPGLLLAATGGRMGG